MGKQGQRPQEKKNQMTLVKWSTNPTHGVEEMEKTMKKDRASALIRTVLSLKMKKGTGLKGTM